MAETVHRSPLHAYVHTSFRAAFGQPNNSLHKDDHWSFQTTVIDKPINVLVNGTPATPAVWIFDPYEVANQVYNTALDNEAAVDEVVILIQQRVKRSGGSKTGGATTDVRRDGEESNRKGQA